VLIHSHGAAGTLMQCVIGFPSPRGDNLSPPQLGNWSRPTPLSPPNDFQNHWIPFLGQEIPGESSL